MGGSNHCNVVSIILKSFAQLPYKLFQRKNMYYMFDVI